ncbi:MAG: hypothetical protein GF334_12405 [Candidatus Altiarchaeales archaeon]|nr:hypothetical protein [Candidatus Altiarchaeales archaeon]
MRLYAAFYKKPTTLFGWCVRIFTGFARYIHSEIVIETDDGRRFWISSETHSGTRITCDISGNPEKWDIYNVYAADSQIMAILAHAKALVHQGYDWHGILLSQLLPFRSHSSGRWFCSEFCAHLLRSIGILSPSVRPASMSPIELYRWLYSFGSIDPEPVAFSEPSEDPTGAP